MELSENEKKIIRDYLLHPIDFIESKFHHLLPDQHYPDGAKLTRGKIDENGVIRRFLMIPQDDNSDSLIIPIETYIEGDSMNHSCTLVSSKMYFHDYSEDKKTYLTHRTVQEGMIFVKSVVKNAMDSAGNRYCLISKSAPSMRYISEFNPEVRERVGNHYYLSRFGIYRSNESCYKKIEIVPFFGRSLLLYLTDGAFSHEKKRLLTYAILKAYLEQISDKNLVHTDINPQNICIKEEIDGFQLTFIDFEDSFVAGAQLSNGLGTPGYLAPEFFKNPTHCERQLEIRAGGEQSWINALKSDFRQRFTAASDLFALGRLLLDYMEIDVCSPYFDLIISMCSFYCHDRPTPEKIKEVLLLNELETSALAIMSPDAADTRLLGIGNADGTPDDARGSDASGDMMISAETSLNAPTKAP